MAPCPSCLLAGIRCTVNIFCSDSAGVLRNPVEFASAGRGTRLGLALGVSPVSPLCDPTGKERANVSPTSSKLVHGNHEQTLEQFKPRQQRLRVVVVIPICVGRSEDAVDGAL